MANRRIGTSRFFSSLGVMHISLIVFFMVTAILLIMNYNSGGAKIARFFRSLAGYNNSVGLIFALIFIVCSVVLTIGLFASINPKYLFVSCLVILVFWAIYIFFSHFRGRNFTPGELVWFQRLSKDLVVLAGLWIITGSYS